MKEMKVIYSKRYPKIDSAELDKEIEQLNTENIFDDGLEEGESIIDFIEHNQEYVPNEERLAEKDLFLKVVKDLSESYEIDADIVEGDISCVAHLYLQSAAYTGTLKKILSGLIVMADELDILPPIKGDVECTLHLSLTYHTHDIYFKGRKITDLDWDD